MIVTKLKFPSHDSEHIFIYKTVKEALKTIENEINAVYNNDSDPLTIEVTFQEMDEDEVDRLLDFEGYLSYKKPTVRELAAKHKLQVKESSDTIDLITGKRISSDE